MRRESRKFDVVVIGGGPAGLCAAIAAARSGAETALVQDRPVFGGCSSSEIRMKICGSVNFNYWSAETGIIDEIQARDRATNALQFFNNGVSNRHWDLTIYECVKEQERLTEFLNTVVTDVEVAGTTGERRIVSVSGYQLGSEKRITFKATQFIDCTGDGTVGFEAGADYRKGREARDEFGENLAPVNSDDVTMGSSILITVQRYPFEVPFEAPAWAYRYTTQEEIGPYRVPVFRDEPLFGGYWWIEIGVPYDTIHENELIKEEGIRQALGVWHYVKNHGPDRETARNYSLEWVGMVAGKRESRRLVGDVLVNESDCFTEREWPDRVCYSGWFLDIHINGGILNKNEPGELSHHDLNYRYFTRVAPFSLPLRAMYSRNVDNLWFAGRDISVTRCALASTRVMGTCANIGQATGTAAAYAATHELMPRQVADPHGSHIGRIQQQLLRDDVNIPRLSSNDEHDIARSARVTATSDAPLDFGEPTGEWVPLDMPRAQIIPFSHDRLDSLSLFVRNASTDAVPISVAVERIDTIWQMEDGDELLSREVELPGSHEGWLNVEVGNLAPPAPCLLRIVLRGNEQVSWAKSSKKEVGTGAQFCYSSDGGPEAGNDHIPSLQEPEIHIPPFRKWIQHKGFLIPIGVLSFGIRTTPVSRPFAASNVTNGKAWSEDWPNIWVSDPAAGFPQSLEVRFAEATRVGRVHVVFDTFHDHNASHREPLWRALTCVRDWKLWAQTDDTWQVVHSEEGNYQRLRRVTFSPVEARALRLQVLATNKAGFSQGDAQPTAGDGGNSRTGYAYPKAEIDGGDSARVFQIRVYSE